MSPKHVKANSNGHKLMELTHYVIQNSKEQQKQMQQKSEAFSKELFIEKYGIRIDMPANYIFGAMFYRKNHDFLIIANRMSFPKTTKFLDFDKIGSDIDPEDNYFLEENLKESESLCLKIY